MQVIETALPGVKIIEPRVYRDARGFFVETFQAERYLAQAGIALSFVQDNQSRSVHGVLRGLHAQRLHPQGKLVRVSRGAVFDVAVDIDPQSATFGQWVGAELTEENQKQLWIPPGYAHGFVVLSDVVDFQYKCTDLYHPEDEIGVRWDDPDIGIDWPIAEPIVSEKDSNLPALTTLARTAAV